MSQRRNVTLMAKRPYCLWLGLADQIATRITPIGWDVGNYGTAEEIAASPARISCRAAAVAVHQGRAAQHYPLRCARAGSRGGGSMEGHLHQMRTGPAIGGLHIALRDVHVAADDPIVV